MNAAGLDAFINGRKVFVYRRSDDSVYASVHDFSHFQVKPLKIVRVPLDYPDPASHPKVAEAIKAFQHAAWDWDWL